MRELTVRTEDAGQRLDRYLQKYMALAPKSFFYKMLRKKNITCNGKKCEGNIRLKAGDKIRLFLSDETIRRFSEKSGMSGIPRFLPPDFSAPVVYEDSQVLIFDKPAGVLSQKAKPDDVSMAEYVLHYLRQKGEITEESLRMFRPAVCNRLDRNTSGLITAAKTSAGARALSALLRERSVKKYYLCLAAGVIREKREISGWLLKDEARNQVRIFPSDPGGADEIHTVYEPVGRGKDLTLLMVELITGRSHQIRAHLAFDGHPVIGDSKYGNEAVNRRFRARYGTAHQLLHAYRMEFPPLSDVLEGLSGKTVCAPLPDRFADILDGEGINREGL